ncbi:Arm DNA-binding domain-containing protein [Stenotrophomonas tumulicola]|uniref:Arm DNA-binding domain-containing protein n=1 Tax=Stenotrophomonas tumulicola TaxID=1685415 RepID=UPI001FE6D0FF|nr:Arm DNA-binding domain-containing protein [Stenotrophomonas tumulicola]
MPLTDAAIRRAKPAAKPQKLADGGGLFLFITVAGAKSWCWKYRSGGKEKLLTLHLYPDVSLAKAREAREDARRLLARWTPASAQGSHRSAHHRRRCSLRGGRQGMADLPPVGAEPPEEDCCLVPEGRLSVHKYALGGADPDDAGMGRLSGPAAHGKRRSDASRSGVGGRRRAIDSKRAASLRRQLAARRRPALPCPVLPPTGTITVMFRGLLPEASRLRARPLSLADAGLCHATIVRPGTRTSR